MTNRQRREAAESSSLLGMIVDRSSFDEDERDDDLLSLADESRRRIKNGKVRRKLRWKPAAFRSKNNKRPVNATTATVNSANNNNNNHNNPSTAATASTSGDAASVFSNRTNKSNASFHTFHSTETPVQSNQTTKKPIKLGRPHYRDTFEGVSTIANEGHYIQAKTKSPTAAAAAATNPTTDTSQTIPHASHLLQRSSTLPTNTTSPSSSFDFQSMDGEAYSVGDLDDVSLDFDPFRLRDNDQQQQQQQLQQQPITANNNRPPRAPQGGDSPIVAHQKRPYKIASPTAAAGAGGRGEPLTILSVAAVRDDEELDTPVYVREEFDDPLQDYYSNRAPPRSTSPTGNLGISPIKLPKHASPFATPTTTPTKPGRPPKAPLRFTSSPLVPPTPTMQEGSPQSLSNYMVTSGQLQGVSMPDMPLTSAAGAASQHLPLPQQQKRQGQQRLQLGSIRPTTRASETLSPPPPPPQTATQTRTRPSKTRNQTGPVDVDKGSFVDGEQHSKAIHDMAAEHLAHGEYEEALEVFEEIFRGQLERYGADHFRVGTALHNIGIVHLKSGNFPKAVEICTLAVTVRKRSLAPNHMDVAVSLAQLGVAHLECRNYRDALVAFREALTIRRQVLGMKHPKVGKILNNVGCALYELQELEGARLAFEEALDIQRESLRSFTSQSDIADSKSISNQILLSIAATLCNIASINVRWSKFEEASIALEEALLLQQSVLGDEHPVVLNTVESIERVEQYDGKANNTTANTADFFSSWTHTSASTSVSDDDNHDSGSGVKKLVSMMSSFTWNRSKKLYEKVEELSREQVTCGGTRDVANDETDEIRSVPLSDEGSTWSYRVKKLQGYEF